jgi:hypothetical protein
MRFQKGNIFTDTGGGTWYILEQLKNKKNADCKNSLQWLTSDPILKIVPELIQQFINTDIRNEGDKIYSEIFNGSFIHLRGGGNWEILYKKLNTIEIQEERYMRFLYVARSLLEN